MIVRPARTDDDEAIAAVARAAGQEGPDSADDPAYRAALHTASTLLVAEEGEAILAFGATTATGQGSMLSDLFVHPDAHGRGAGSALLSALWPDAPEGPRRFTFSSLHPSALPLYARAGLVPGWPLLYLTGRPSPASRSGLTVRTVPAAEAADAEADLVGFRRDAAYGCWLSGSGGQGLVVRDGAATVAVGAGTPSDLAHLACVDEDRSSDALRAVLAHLAGGGEITACLPGPHPAVRELLEEGFRIGYLDVSMATPDVALEVGWVYSPGLA